MGVEVLLAVAAHHVAKILLVVTAHQTAGAGAKQVALGVQEAQVSLLVQQEQVSGGGSLRCQQRRVALRLRLGREAACLVVDMGYVVNRGECQQGRMS